MDIIRNIPMMTIILSLFSGSLCFVLKGKAARFYTIFYEVILLVACGFVLWYIVTTGEAVTYSMGEFPAPWGNEIRAGILEALLAVLFMIIMICCGRLCILLLLARISSNTSGFFLCGMMLDPVVHSLGSLTKPKF